MTDHAPIEARITLHGLERLGRAAYSVALVILGVLMIPTARSLGASQLELARSMTALATRMEIRDAEDRADRAEMRATLARIEAGCARRGP